jgi:hypothetical protein
MAHTVPFAGKVCHLNQPGGMFGGNGLACSQGYFRTAKLTILTGLPMNTTLVDCRGQAILTVQKRDLTVANAVNRLTLIILRFRHDTDGTNLSAVF